MATADYSLRFGEKNISKALCWTLSENIRESSLFQKKGLRYSVINIDKNSKEVQLELENKSKNKFTFHRFYLRKLSIYYHGDFSLFKK